MRRNEMAEEVDQRLLTPEELVTLSVVESHTIPTMQHSLLAPEAGHVQKLVQIIRRLTLKTSLGDGPYADYQ
jgi:hypothetical protein